MFFIFLISAVIIFTADIFLKTYMWDRLAYSSVPVIKNIFHISVTCNTGAAFGIFQGKTFFLIVVTFIFLLFFLWFIFNEKNKPKIFFLACGLILGGAVSNLYDRIFNGCVIDYLDFIVWPVFNLSDSAICVGVGILVLLEIWKIKRTRGK